MVANPVTGKLTLVHSAETSESHPEHSADKNLIYDVFEAADVSKEKSAANFRAFESSVELLICLHSRKHLDINTATVVSAGAEGWIRAWSLNPKVGRISVGLRRNFRCHSRVASAQIFVYFSAGLTAVVYSNSVNRRRGLGRSETN